MKISELVDFLMKISREHGDCQVFLMEQHDKYYKKMKKEYGINYLLKTEGDYAYNEEDKKIILDNKTNNVTEDDFENVVIFWAEQIKE